MFYWLLNINPLSPNIDMQILQTDLYTFPLRISWENLIKDHGILSLVITLLILITLSLDNVWILLGEIWCWSLLVLKGLNKASEGEYIKHCFSFNYVVHHRKLITYMSYLKSYFFVHYTSPIDAVYFLKINKASEGEYTKQYLSFHCPSLTK